MRILLELVGLCVMAYIAVVAIIMAVMRCSADEAREKVAAFFRENGRVPYELSRDANYLQALNDAVKTTLGEKRYEELCGLENYSSTIRFSDNHAGLPSVKITVTCADEMEKLRLKNILDSVTCQYLLNYDDRAHTRLFSEWAYNHALRLPMLNILYARNAKEYGMLSEMEQAAAGRTTARYADVTDDTDMLL